MSERLKPNLPEALPTVVTAAVPIIMIVGLIGNIAKIASLTFNGDGHIKTILDQSGAVGGPVALASLSTPFMYAALDQVRVRRNRKLMKEATPPTNSTI